MLLEVVGRRAVRDLGRRRTELHDVAQHRDVQMGESALATAPAATRAAVSRAEARSRTSRRVVEAVLLHAREVGVTRTGLGQRRRRATGCGRHLLGPLAGGPFAVAHQDGERAPERAPVPDAAEELDLVLLEPHARPAAVAEAAARQLIGDVVDQDGKTGGQALDGDHQRRSVRLARRQVPQHGASWIGGALRAPPSRRSGHRILRQAPHEPWGMSPRAQPLTTPGWLPVGTGVLVAAGVVPVAPAVPAAVGAKLAI